MDKAGRDLAEAQEGLELTRQVLAHVASRLAAGTDESGTA
jgi:hypothetical protein